MKHKHTALALLIGTVSIVPMYGVFAETSTSTSTTTPRGVREEFKREIEMKRQDLKDARENFKDEVKQKREEIKSELKDRKEEIKSEFKGDLAKKKASNVSRVLAATASRLDKLVARIESRIQKIKAKGGNTTTAEASVALAKTDIASARVHISAIGSFDLTGASSTAQANFEHIRTEAKLAKDSLASAHKNLSNAVSSLKGQEKLLHIDNEATSTATTTVSH